MIIIINQTRSVFDPLGAVRSYLLPRQQTMQLLPELSWPECFLRLAFSAWLRGMSCKLGWVETKLGCGEIFASISLEKLLNL